MTDDGTTVAAPLFKVTTVWVAVGITSWADAAAFAATVYTTLLCAEWVWKKFLRGIFLRKGWIKKGEDGE